MFLLICIIALGAFSVGTVAGIVLAAFVHAASEGDKAQTAAWDDFEAHEGR